MLDISCRKRYLNGLDKLEYAAEQISRMRFVLTELKPQLETSAKETADTMQRIEAENAIIKQQTILVKRDEHIVNAQAKIAKQLKMECEAELAEALPALNDAIGLLIFHLFTIRHFNIIYGAVVYFT